LEANFSCFAKIIWMSSWFPKLLELLLWACIYQALASGLMNDGRQFGDP
jgi:hypothetical protein